MIRTPMPGPVRYAVGALVVLAVLFVGLGAVLTPHAHGRLLLTLVLLATDLVIAGALVTGWYPVRPVAQGLTIFGALVHVLVLLRSGPVLLRGCSGLLVAAHGYALALLFQLSVSEQDEENDEGATECVAVIEPAAGSSDFEESPDIEPDTPDLPDAGAAGDTSRSPAAPQVSTEEQPARPDPPNPAAVVGAVEPAEDVDTIEGEEPAEPPEPTGSDSQDVDQQDTGPAVSVVGADRSVASKEDDR